LEQAVEYVFSEDQPATPSPTLPEQASGGSRLLALTSHEEEELTALVAQGLTNRQIASELSISEYTAATHVARILKKLGLNSRSQLATWVTAQGLPSPDNNPHRT
jgi:DNA-binding NarL/FixJ family response regulator